MEKTRPGVLGLPREFSLDPDQRQDQVWCAIYAGFNRLTTRFGKYAARLWEPTHSNTFLHNTTDGFVDSVLGENNPPENIDPRSIKQVKTNLAKMRLYYQRNGSGRQLHVNSLVLDRPLETAVNVASTVIYAWGDGHIPSWRLTRSENGEVRELRSKVLKAFMDETAKRAHNELVEYSTFESLGLFKPPLSRLKDRVLIDRAILAILVKQLAQAFRPNISDAIFRITQGKYSPEEIEILNKKMGTDPMTGCSNNFFVAGFLRPLGSLRAPLPLARDVAKQAMSYRAQKIRDSLKWTCAGLGLESPKLLPNYWKRPDIQDQIKTNSRS